MKALELARQAYHAARDTDWTMLHLGSAIAAMDASARSTDPLTARAYLHVALDDLLAAWKSAAPDVAPLVRAAIIAATEAP